LFYFIAPGWHELKNRRIFFENFAKANKFDPLVAKNWYLQSKKKIFAIQGARRIIQYHERSISKALVNLFPEFGLTL